ncbi:ABC transporter substrate-binding protein [Castellaniella sp.]|uniref:ABC transporter substrate-binding protein n=1 Tax=Castellaniella sp. TaxID=1955812 RepID=UPI00356883DC
MKKSSLALLCTALFGLSALAPVHAEELVVGLFGGSFADDSKTCHIEPFEQKTGAKVLTKLGNSAQFAAGVRATRGQSDFDVLYMDNSLATQLKNEGLLETIAVDQLANAADVAPMALDKDNQYVAFMTGATVIVYDTTRMQNPPQAWADLLKPEYQKKLAIGDISGTSGMQFLLALNRLEGGTLDNMDPGFEAIKPLAKASAQLYTQADQIIPMFERKEIDLAVWYPDRAGSAIDAGLPLAVVYPKEGAVGILPVVVIPKGAKHPELALKYIDELLSREGQACFAEKKYAGPVNTQVKLSDKAAAIVPVGENFERLWLPDPTEVARHLPSWMKRWQREVAR